MRLLFDANPSPRLPALLADAFAGSMHVTGIGGLAADDLSIWAYARDNGFTIVSKDSDLHRMSFVLGAPPRSYGCALAIVPRPSSSVPRGIISRASSSSKTPETQPF